MYAKLVVNVLGYGFTLVMLLGSFETVLVVLDSFGYSRSPILDRCHAFLPKEPFRILINISILAICITLLFKTF